MVSCTLALSTVWPDWVIYCTLGNFLKLVATIILPKSPTFLVKFCKCVKIFHYSSESYLGQFYRHLATFFWSHWLSNLSAVGIRGIITFTCRWAGALTYSVLPISSIDILNPSFVLLLAVVPCRHQNRMQRVIHLWGRRRRCRSSYKTNSIKGQCDQIWRNFGQFANFLGFNQYLDPL